MSYTLNDSFQIPLVGSTIAFSGTFSYSASDLVAVAAPGGSRLFRATVLSNAASVLTLTITSIAVIELVTPRYTVLDVYSAPTFAANVFCTALQTAYAAFAVSFAAAADVAAQKVATATLATAVAALVAPTGV